MCFLLHSVWFKLFSFGCSIQPFRRTHNISFLARKRALKSPQVHKNHRFQASTQNIPRHCCHQVMEVLIDRAGAGAKRPTAKFPLPAARRTRAHALVGSLCAMIFLIEIAQLLCDITKVVDLSLAFSGSSYPTF